MTAVSDRLAAFLAAQAEPPTGQQEQEEADLALHLFGFDGDDGESVPDPLAAHLAAMARAALLYVVGGSPAEGYRQRMTIVLMRTLAGGYAFREAELRRALETEQV